MTAVMTNGKYHKSTALPFSFLADDLRKVEAIFSAKLQPFRSQFGDLIAHLDHYRGKRLRPMLLLLTAHACGGINANHHTLSAVVEMIHTATLVHDDVLDEAEIRRHQDTVNAKWSNKISILLGDLLFTNAFHMASTVDAKACEWIGEVTNRVCAGELRQLVERGNLDLAEETYFEVIAGKTGALTECCCLLGAHYSGAAEELVQQMAAVGLRLGMAFQIMDDVLDLIGTEAKTGKTLGTDLEQQNLTLPMIHMLQHLSTGDALRVKAWLKSNPYRHREIIREYLDKTDSIHYARQYAEQLIYLAKQDLQQLPASKSKEMLYGILDWSVDREQ